MATVVLVFETAVDNHDVIIVSVVGTVEDVDESILLNTGQAVRFVFRNEVGKLLLMLVINIHDG